VGGDEAGLAGSVEPTLKYHPDDTLALTACTTGGTVTGGQFDWGGRLRKGNGGAQRYPQAEWKPAVERKGRRVLDSESDNSSW
jgi:hypothetical protein